MSMLKIIEVLAESDNIGLGGHNGAVIFKHYGGD